MTTDDPPELKERIAGWEVPTGDDAPSADDALRVDVLGFEGPLDLLLALARTQKVDLAHISVVMLADQYLAFIAKAQQLKLEVAADYLVMAAWLAFLKSKLLLPKEAGTEETLSGEDIQARLQFRLMRLDAMRNAAAQLLTRKRLDRDVFGRGMPEGMRTIRSTEHTAQIYDLLKAYAEQRVRTIKHVHVVKVRQVWSIKDARQRLERLVGASNGEWVQLELFLDDFIPRSEAARTVLAASFGASLEMAREGYVDLSQDAPFAPIYMRKSAGGAWNRIG
jgi:segregation and condensation protein A